MMKVVAGGGQAIVGFAVKGYDVERNEVTCNNTAGVWLSWGFSNGTTFIWSDISKDGKEHRHPGHLEDHIPKTLPYDVALLIDKDGNIPQILFNDDSVWHDFAPNRVALKAGLWFPFLYPRLTFRR
jgi:hypothetical protein